MIPAGPVQNSIRDWEPIFGKYRTRKIGQDPVAPDLPLN